MLKIQLPKKKQPNIILTLNQKFISSLNNLKYNQFHIIYSEK